MDPSWWNKQAGITFDEDFFYHPAKRLESERKMAHCLYERWGQYGLGDKDSRDLPVVDIQNSRASVNRKLSLHTSLA